MKRPGVIAPRQFDRRRRGPAGAPAVMILAGALAVMILAGACGAGSGPGGAASSGARPARAVPARPAAEAVVTPPARATAADLERDVLGWLAIGDLDGTLASLARHAGAAGGAAVASDDLKRDLAARLGAAGLAAAIDGGRPIVVALLDPRAHPRRPVIAALPVRSRDAFLDAVAAAGRPGARPRRTGDTAAVDLGDGTRLHAWVGADRRGGQVAVVAFEPGLLPAARALVAPLGERAGRGVVVRMSIDRVSQVYGAEMHAVMAQLMLATGAADAQTAHATRLLPRLVSLVESASALEARLVLGDAGLDVSVRMLGAPKSAWADHIAAQRPGPVWGAELIPAEAMLVYSTHLSPAGLEREVDDLASFLASVTGEPALPAERQQAWQDAVRDLGGVFAGEAIYAVWPAAGGGIGLGGAYRVAGEGEARRARDLSGRAYDALEPVLGRVIALQLGLDPERIRFGARLRRGAERVAGVPVDRVDLTPRWPRGAGAERRMFRWLFGDRLTLATAFVGDRIVYVAGRDWRPRLEAMLRASAGDPGRSILDEPSFAQARDTRPEGRVTLTYVRTARLARFVRAVLDRTADVSRDQEAMLAPFLRPQTADEAIVLTTNVTPDGPEPSYALTTHLPAGTFAELGRLGGAMLRVGLSPILGPPVLPPLPTPPPAVTPPPDTPDEGSGDGAPAPAPGGPPGPLPGAPGSRGT